MDKGVKEFFDKQLDFSTKHFNFKDCPYYPCHKVEGEINCLFCYCPFYPCNNKIGQGKWLKLKGKKIYDCSDCYFIHRDEVVKRILTLLYENKSIKRIGRIIRKEFNR